MVTVNKILPQGQGLSKVLLKRAATVQLDWSVRQTARFEATDSEGRTLGVALPEGSVVRGGDVLVAEDGSLVQVQAAEQPVMAATACATHGSPLDLVRAAYHLGSRHVALALQADRLLFAPDPAVAALLRGMHMDVAEAQAAFEPEGEISEHHGHAHASHDHSCHSHSHSHSHDHHENHDHGHGKPAARGIPVPVAVRAAPAPHVHGPGCNHGHDHDH